MTNQTTDLISAEREQALLAALAKDPDLFRGLSKSLPNDLFTAEAVQWSALKAAIENGLPPEIPTHWLPSVSPIVTANELLDLAQRRRLNALIQRASTNIANVDHPMSDWIDELVQDVSQLKGKNTLVPHAPPKPMTEMFDTVRQSLSQAREQASRSAAGISGLPTGYKFLDDNLGGLQTGLHILGGEPGIGKTTLAMEMVLNSARAGFPVIYLTFDEEAPRLVLRALCQTRGLDCKKFADGHLNGSSIEQVMTEEAEVFSRLHVLKGRSDLTTTHLYENVSKILRNQDSNRALIVIDYLQIWAAGARRFSEFRHEVARLVAQLGDLATELNSPILAISSQHRSGQGTSEIGSLEGTSDLEYSADSVMLLVSVQVAKRATAYDPMDIDTKNSRMVNLVLKKNRYGAIGSLIMRFKPSVSQITEA